MEVYDIAMLVVLAGATIFGAWKGMAWQIASLASLILSYFMSLKFSSDIAPYFGEQAPWNRFLAMLAIYLATSFGIWMAFRLVANLIDQVKLQDFDRHIGALFGAAKGVLLCIAITFFAVTLSDRSRDYVLRSQSGRYISIVLDKSEGIMPSELKQVLGPYIDRLEHELDPNQPAPSKTEAPAASQALRILEQKGL